MSAMQGDISSIQQEARALSELELSSASLISRNASSIIILMGIDFLFCFDDFALF
jgi:hypothetical protein